MVNLLKTIVSCHIPAAISDLGCVEPCPPDEHQDVRSAATESGGSEGGRVAGGGAPGAGRDPVAARASGGHVGATRQGGRPAAPAAPAQGDPSAPAKHPWLIAPAPKRILSSIGVCMSILTRKLMRTSRRGGRWRGIRRAVRAVCACGGVVRPAHNPTCALI